MIRQMEELKALVALLDDPDRSIHGAVVDRLVEVGQPAIRLLENTWETRKDPALQGVIEEVILKIQQEGTLKMIKDWSDCRGEQLLYGAYLIARSHYPELQFEEMDYQVDAFKREIWLELNDRLTALEKVRVINHFLYDVHGFNRSIKGVLSPPLFLINHVLDTHKGLPISLGILYAEIAQRLELPIYPVDLPYNFLLCYHDPTYLDDPDGILFYINPYTKGTVLGRDEVEHFIEQQKLEVKPEFLMPCSNIDAIIRLADGLRFAFNASRMNEQVMFLDQIIRILKKGSEDQTP